MEDDDRVFEIIESRPAVANSLTKKKDGFSRQQVVDAFAQAFRMIGGVPRLALWANANPDKFYQLYARLMPSTSIHIGDNSSLVIQHAIPKTTLDDHPIAPEQELVPGGE